MLEDKSNKRIRCPNWCITLESLVFEKSSFPLFNFFYSTLLPNSFCFVSTALFQSIFQEKRNVSLHITCLHAKDFVSIHIRVKLCAGKVQLWHGQQQTIYHADSWQTDCFFENKFIKSCGNSKHNQIDQGVLADKNGRPSRKPKVYNLEFLDFFCDRSSERIKKGA